MAAAVKGSHNNLRLAAATGMVTTANFVSHVRSSFNAQTGLATVSQGICGSGGAFVGTIDVAALTERGVLVLMVQ